MSDTPRTDAMPWIPNERFVHATDEDLNRFVRKKEVKELERELSALRSDVERHIEIAADLASENAALRAEVERLREDAERYRWLRDERLSGNDGYSFAMAMGWKPEYMSEMQVDAAIDAARKEGK